MLRRTGFLLVLLLATFVSPGAHGASKKYQRQVGLGFGTVTPFPVGSFPYALTAVLEGTYRWKFLGLSILATATSSPKTDGTYWFGSRGGYQQVFLEPRIYLSIFRVGGSIGVKLSSGSSGTIEGFGSYGPMFGVEVPIRRFSVGLDNRYLFTVGQPSLLSTVLMFRFGF